MTATQHMVDCTAFGVAFRLSASDEDLLGKMTLRAPLGVEPCPADTREVRDFALTHQRNDSTYHLRIGHQTAAEGPALSQILDCLSRELIIHVAEYAVDRVFVHAGVVGWNGRALILPGTSFAGKTTLVAELVRAGATYYSDEYAVLDERGKVHPYARDLQMRELGTVEQYPISVSQLNGSVGEEILPVSHVVFADYYADAHWKPVRMSRGVAALEMMRHSIPVQRSPVRVMATLAKVMETASACRGKRGDARETAHQLLAALTTRGLFA